MRNVKSTTENRRVLHVQTVICIDKYVEFPTHDEAMKALVDIAHGSPFRKSLLGAPQAARYRGYKASLLERVPSGWKPDKEPGK